MAGKRSAVRKGKPVSRQEALEKLLKAVEYWIRAEYYLRLGSSHLSPEAMDEVVGAEFAVRQAATGCKYLPDAYKVVQKRDKKRQARKGK